MSPQKFILHPLSEWFPGLYPWHSSQRNSPVVCYFSMVVLKILKLNFFYWLNCSFQLPNFFNPLDSKLQTCTIFISCHKSPMLFLKKNVSSCHLSFHFPCFPVPHPFHLSPRSLFQEPPLLVFLSIFSCVHRDQIDLSKTLALIWSFRLCPSWLRGKFIGSLWVLRNISCGESIEFNFHFKNWAKGNLSHQRKTCFLGNCLFEDYLKHVFLDSLDEGELAEASLKVAAGGGVREPREAPL